MELKSSNSKDLIIIKLCLVRICKIDFFLPYDIVIN